MAQSSSNRGGKGSPLRPAVSRVPHSIAPAPVGNYSNGISGLGTRKSLSDSVAGGAPPPPFGAVGYPAHPQNPTYFSPVPAPAAAYGIWFSNWSFYHSIVDWLIEYFWLHNFLIDWLFNWLFFWSVDWMIDSSIGCSIDWLIDWIFSVFFHRWPLSWVLDCQLIPEICLRSSFGHAAANKPTELSRNVPATGRTTTNDSTICCTVLHPPTLGSSRVARQSDAFSAFHLPTNSPRITRSATAARFLRSNDAFQGGGLCRIPHAGSPSGHVVPA